MSSVFNTGHQRHNSAGEHVSFLYLEKNNNECCFSINIRKQLKISQENLIQNIIF